MKICLFGSGSNKVNEKYLKEGYDLGVQIAKNNHCLVFGGGANGMMGSVARGVSDNDGFVRAIIPDWMTDFEPLYDECDDIIYTKSMDERKRLFIEKSDAFITVAGGIGTLDELFEAITLKKLRMHNKPIVILNTYSFYDPLILMLEEMIRENTIPEDNRNMVKVVKSIPEAFEYLDGYDFENADEYGI
ncbi:MAG: Rossman fold protein, TIGR00730 family [Methanosphaera sp. rholeuAM130]|nr:MAG: Rossman fold protein, TIGR00730 family [Methanosphaera sp. rholeuAM130]